MKINLIEESKVNYEDVRVGALIVLEDSFWTIFYNNEEENPIILVSLKSEEVLSSFRDLKDLSAYLKMYEAEIKRIVKFSDFQINIILKD